MKKLIVLVVLIVVALFLMGTDIVVGPVQNWVVKNQNNPSAPRVLYAQAGYLWTMQRDAKAVELYQSAFNLFPGYKDEASAHYRVGFYYESKKDYPKAIAEFQLVINKWPDLAEKQQLSQRIDRFKAYMGGSN